MNMLSNFTALGASHLRAFAWFMFFYLCGKDSRCCVYQRSCYPGSCFFGIWANSATGMCSKTSNCKLLAPCIAQLNLDRDMFFPLLAYHVEF